MLVQKHRIRAPGNGIAEDQNADEKHKDNAEEIGEGCWFSARLIRSDGHAHAPTPKARLECCAPSVLRSFAPPDSQGRLSPQKWPHRESVKGIINVSSSESVSLPTRLTRRK